MVRIKVELTPRGERALRGMQRADRWLPRAVHEATRLVARRVQREAQRRAPVRTGGGRRSIGIRATHRGHAVVTDLHMLVMDEGRRPGAAMPPVAPIERWARRKLGQRGLGYVIARSIARKGIKPRRFFAAAIRQVTVIEKPKLDRDVGRIVRRIVRQSVDQGP